MLTVTAYTQTNASGTWRSCESILSVSSPACTIYAPVRSVLTGGFHYNFIEKRREVITPDNSTITLNKSYPVSPVVNGKPKVVSGVYYLSYRATSNFVGSIDYSKMGKPLA